MQTKEQKYEGAVERNLAALETYLGDRHAGRSVHELRRVMGIRPDDLRFDGRLARYADKYSKRHNRYQLVD